MSDPESRAVAYAETTLRVHEVWDESKQAQSDLKEAHKAMIEAAAQKRKIAEEIGHRTALVTSDERGKHHDLSATAFEQHIRVVLQLDTDLTNLRQRSMEAQMMHDSAEAAVREAEFILRRTAARMEELGGLLTFYAAVKTTKTRSS